MRPEPESRGSRPTPILVWGSGGHGTVVIDLIRVVGQYRVACLLDDVSSEPPVLPLEVPLYRSTRRLPEILDTGVEHIIIAIGDCEGRLRCASIADDHGFQFPTLIHPSAVVASSANIGPGTVVAAGAILCPGVELGKHVIVNTGSTVDHQSVVADGAHISAGACVGGRVRIGRGAFVGMGATVVTDVTIGEGAQIGAGSLVLRPVPPRSLAYGVPARVHGPVRPNV